MIGSERPVQVHPLWSARDLLNVVADPEQAWKQHGACRGADCSLFDPAAENERHRYYPPRAAYAAAYCWDDCPVRAACDAHARERNEQGVWGGHWHYEPRGKGAHRATPIPPRTRSAA